MSKKTETTYAAPSYYSPLKNTWCGKGIPSSPVDTFNPPYHYPNKCPGAWDNPFNGVPSGGIQIVIETPKQGYNILTHNTPYTSSGYLGYSSLGNTSQYKPKFRKCDGTFVDLQ